VDAICLVVAGIVRATLPAPEFTLGWVHSVERIRWEERYRVDADGLRLVEARIQGSGAGMEAPAEAVLDNGWWTWRPSAAVAELVLARSTYAGDYTLCWRERCSELSALVGSADGDVVVIRRCDS
jgi:hypothetical protein